MCAWRSGCRRIIRCGRSGPSSNEALAALSGRFEALYSPIGRPSIPPEKLLRAMLLQAFFSIRSERQLMERLDYDLLFRWFVGLPMDDAVWDHDGVLARTATGCSRRMWRGSSWRRCWRSRRVKRLLSTEHFSVDGTLIEAWASMKSFQPKDGSGEPPGPRPQRRAQLPRREALERDARLDHRSRRPALPQGDGKESRLCFMGHALMENRYGLVVDAA